MYPEHSNAHSNRLIVALPSEERQDFLAGCELVDLEYSKVIGNPQDRLKHVHFPTRSFLSLTLPVTGHSNLEVGLVGNEGMVGMPLLLGIPVLGLNALVQGPGSALRMPAKVFLNKLEHSPTLRIHLNRYLFVVMSQLAQAAACHRFHLVEARLARWLMMTRDRAHGNSFAITHEFLSYILGVRRVGITNAAGALQQRGLITYSRGDLTILDPKGLLAASCACYELDVSTYKQVMRRRLPLQAVHSP